jgi:hypothetical protein
LEWPPYALPSYAPDIAVRPRQGPCMSDLIYIAAGFAIVGVFVLYAIGLRRV